jgi:hypothetical protein
VNVAIATEGRHEDLSPHIGDITGAHVVTFWK